MIHNPDICSCNHGWVDVHDGVRPCEVCRPADYERWLLGPDPEQSQPAPELPLKPDWNQVRKDLR